jgi:hypothetical protein
MGSSRELKQLLVERAGPGPWGHVKRQGCSFPIPHVLGPDKDKVCKRGGQSPGTTSWRRRAWRALSTTRVPVPDRRQGICRALTLHALPLALQRRPLSRLQIVGRTGSQNALEACRRLTEGYGAPPPLLPVEGEQVERPHVENGLVQRNVEPSRKRFPLNDAGAMRPGGQ